MPSYKVVYYNGRGYAEPTRMMLAYVGQDFEDVRYSLDEEWPKHKEKTPFQQLPMLEVDGHLIPQSRAMHGFVAREYGLNGANNEETTKIDIVLAVLEDVRIPLRRINMGEKDEAKKKEQLDEFYAKTAPRFLTGLENLLKTNNGGDGFFIGSKISRADIFFHVTSERLPEEELKKYPKLFALRDRIAEDPKIAAYLAKRPVTPW